MGGLQPLTPRCLRNKTHDDDARHCSYSESNVQLDGVRRVRRYPYFRHDKYIEMVVSVSAMTSCIRAAFRRAVQTFPTPKSINQSYILSEQMQKHCSHCTSIWGDITCREMTVKKGKFKVLFKCRQCHWWRHFWRKTVQGFCRRNTERSITDCFKTCLWHSKIRWWRRNDLYCVGWGVKL